MIHFRFLRTIFPVMVTASLLMGCQTTFDHKTGVFRNREFDYLHQPVEHRPPLIIPSGVSAPTFATKNPLPPGVSSYPAENSVTMTPPGFDKIIPLPEDPTDKKSSEKTALFSTKKTDTQTAKEQIQALQHELNSIKAQSPQATPMESSLGFDSNNVGLLKIQAPFNQAWEAVIHALGETGYSITKVDKGSHVIYVDVPATSDPVASAQHLLLFVTRKDNAVHVSVFTDKGVLDHSDASASLLTQLQAKLKSAPN